MDNILNGLNAAQTSAVTSPASVVQILAPPGSGKTKTLTSRVAYLLSHHHYKPWNILCLTFTIKSSREMKERIAKLIGNGMETRLILGTFHSVCRRYLVSYGHLIGLRKGFGIADSSDSLAIINRIIKRFRLNIDPKAARSRISSSKAQSINYTDLAPETANKKNVDQQEFLTVFEAYETQLASSNLLDYDDLLLRCVDLLKQHPSCVSNVEVVLIDEFQDTNLVQFDLMRLFAAKNKRVTTVGDPDQSIYGWRSAEIKNLKRMQKQYPDTLVVHLEDNYRSSGAILLAALEVIQQDESRPPKPLLPTHCPGTVPVLRKLPSAAIEAAWIVSEIQRLLAMTGNLLTFSDFAILLRSASLSRHIESAMGKAGMPYRMVGGLRFFDRLEIKILLDYLRVISQPDNNDALARIINVPPRRIGDTTIKSLLEEAETKGLTLWDLARDIIQGHITSKTKLSKAAEQGLGSLINIVLKARMKIFDSNHPHFPENLLEYIIKQLEFRKYLEKMNPEDHETRWANVEELLAQASDCSVNVFETQDGEDYDDSLPQIEGIERQTSNKPEEALSKYLANVALSTELQREENSKEDSVRQERVTISTIHAAKGLEWPVVYIPSTYEGSIPHSRAEDANEERRLLYVAMTRAQALLYMSCPSRNSMREETTLSSFLSAKKVSPYLVNKGPSFKHGVVQDIARILRRDCPSEQYMAESARTLESSEDDLWPISGEEDPEAMEARWKTHGGSGAFHPNQHIAKRRKTTTAEAYDLEVRSNIPYTITAGNLATNINITMQNRATFTIGSHMSDFVSATSQLQNKNRLDKTQQNGNSGASTADRGPTCKSAIVKTTKRSQGQGNLMAYWGSDSEKISANERSIPMCASAHDTRAEYDSIAKVMRGQDEFVPEDAIVTSRSTRFTPSSKVAKLDSGKPMAVIPQALADHKIHVLTNIALPRPIAIEDTHTSKQYVFLSSSPPPIDTVEEMEGSTSQGRLERITDSNKQRAFDKSESNSEMHPATTCHITSVAQVKAAGTGPRKTLGVRRSMAGWSARGGHGFAPPSRARPNT